MRGQSYVIILPLSALLILVLGLTDLASPMTVLTVAALITLALLTLWLVKRARPLRKLPLGISALDPIDEADPTMRVIQQDSGRFHGGPLYPGAA